MKLCPQEEATIMLEWHLGRVEYLIFQPQTKASNPTTSKQEQGDALIQESKAQLGTQAWSSLSWLETRTQRQLFGCSPLPPLLGLLPHTFSLFTHPTDCSAQ